MSRIQGCSHCHVWGQGFCQTSAHIVSVECFITIIFLIVYATVLIELFVSITSVCFIAYHGKLLNWYIQQFTRLITVTRLIPMPTRLLDMPMDRVPSYHTINPIYPAVQSSNSNLISMIMIFWYLSAYGMWYVLYFTPHDYNTIVDHPLLHWVWAWTL